MVVRRLTDQQDRALGRHCLTWCPGCDQTHAFKVVNEDGSPPADGHHVWEWDGNTDAPTFSPSLLAYHTVKTCPDRHPHYEPCPDLDACDRSAHYVSPDGPAHTLPCPSGPDGNCHSFLRVGRWEFLTDSAHRLAGQTVPMVPLPDWLCKATRRRGR